MKELVRRNLKYGGWSNTVKFNLGVLVALFLLIVWFNAFFGISIIIVVFLYLIFRGQEKKIRTKRKDPPI